MKVLFAVSNEEISESIVKKYQKEYKEIISYKNVYYFNAIVKELQKDKNYDRIVISEELEAFANTQYSQIDKFIFDKLDNISDEASNLKGEDIPIILICSDRREKSEEMLVKLFGIGIYNALLGNDRSVSNVCQLLNKPRVKKEAKIYYKIDSDDVSYQSENENDVSEVEIQNILAHYKRLGKDEKKYVESFDNIASQYNDTQLRIITKFLPLNVRAVLEEKSAKYQQIISFNSRISDNLREQSVRREKTEKEGTSEKLLKSGNRDQILSKPVVIPSAVNMNSTKKLAKTKNPIRPVEPTKSEKVVTAVKKIGPMFEDSDDLEKILEQNQIQEKETKAAETKTVEKEPVKEEPVVQAPKRRGRPRKNPLPTEAEAEAPKRKRGRPRKNTVVEDQEELQLPGLEDDEQILPGFSSVENNEEETILPGFDEKEDELDSILPGFEDLKEQEEEENNTILPGFEENEEDEKETILPGFDEEPEEKNETGYWNDSRVETPRANIQKYNYAVDDVDISNLLTSDKKVACFIGTSKNGTSFIVNNLAEITAKNGINTAILDLTKNRNSYYIYTKNEEDLRKTAMNCVNNLLQGQARGIEVKRNLTVYTSLPDETDGIENAGKILQTLLKTHSLVLIDCDFETPMNYFEKAQEIYLVQSMDILTIQPLTAFLRELKSKNILDENKLRIILNKTVQIRGINDKVIIGGMSNYNDPSMSFMTELFNKNTIKYITIPFNTEVYTIYLEGIINCEISTKGYPKNIMQILNELSNMVYPLVSGKSTYVPPRVESNGFTPSMNSTLNQMKKRY